MLAITAYLGLYRLMDAVLSGACTPAVIADCAVFVMAGTVGRMVLLGASGVLSHKGAYGALFRVRCMVTEHLAKVPLGALDERSTGAVKTVLNEDIEKLELFLAHNLPEFVAYLTGPVVIFFLPSVGECPIGADLAAPLAAGGNCDGGDLWPHERNSGGHQPLPGELQLGDDRVCLRDAAHQSVQYGEPVVSEVFPTPFRRKTGSGIW